MKGYNARQLRTESPDKGWMTSSINRLLEKFRDTGTVDGRDRAVKDHEVPAWMKTLTRRTIWLWVKRTSPELAAQSMKYHKRTGIPKSSVVCIIRKDLQLKCLRGDLRKS